MFFVMTQKNARPKSEQLVSQYLFCDMIQLEEKIMHEACFDKKEKGWALEHSKGRKCCANGCVEVEQLWEQCAIIPVGSGSPSV